MLIGQSVRLFLAIFIFFDCPRIMHHMHHHRITYNCLLGICSQEDKEKAAKLEAERRKQEQLLRVKVPEGKATKSVELKAEKVRDFVRVLGCLRAYNVSMTMYFCGMHHVA